MSCVIAADGAAPAGAPEIPDEALMISYRALGPGSWEKPSLADHKEAVQELVLALLDRGWTISPPSEYLHSQRTEIVRKGRPMADELLPVFEAITPIGKCGVCGRSLYANMTAGDCSERGNNSCPLRGERWLELQQIRGMRNTYIRNEPK